MSTITKPILLDDTGKEIVAGLTAIKNAIRGYEEPLTTWSITINTAQASPILSQMGGDVTAWMRYRSKIGRYIMSADGKAKKLDKTNSRLLENGDEVDETQGNIMVRLPRLYYKVDTVGDIVTLTMCEREFGENCEELDESWVGAYLGYTSGGKLCSKSGVNPTRSKTITQFWNEAQANGTKWGLVNYEMRKHMIVIYLCEYLDLNSQACLGNGMTGTGNNWCSAVQNALTGATAELGDACGKVDFNTDGQLVGGACHTSLFGIEDTYGWFWEMIQGCYFGNSANDNQDGTECFIYQDNAMPTSDELAEHPGITGDGKTHNLSNEYRQLTRNTSGGWLKNIIAGSKFDVLAKTCGGSSTSYWCDYNYANNTGQLLLWGGLASYGSDDGLSYSHSFNAFSYSSSVVGSRLAYYGKDAEIIPVNSEE